MQIHDLLVLEPVINESDLVISHCGAGILLECLRSTNQRQTVNVAVVNETLMNNHQTELADKLHSEGFNMQSTVSKIMADLQTVLSSSSTFNRYPPANTGAILDLVDELLL